MTAEDFREIVLSLPGATEGAHMGHPDFRANGRIFATLHGGDAFGMVKLTPEEQQEFMRQSPAVFIPSAGAWGRQGCTNVRLTAATERVLRPAVLLAWEGVMSRPARTPGTGRAARPRKRPADKR